jgi:polysaccharide export outer membrane protein
MKGHREPIFSKLWPLMVVAVLGSTLLLSCQIEPTKPGYPHPQASEMIVIPSPRVALVPGDVVEVKFFYTPELNESQTVRPDGKILLQLIGEVEVEGKTPAELRDELLRLYAPNLNAPEIAVVVRSFYERRVFVGGQVMAPGIIEMPGEMNVLEAIMQAGGFNMREAELRNVVVIRHKNDQRYGYSINLKPALAGDDTRPFYLEPKDIVYVPRTKIAQVNQWIDQHINKIIPDTGLFFMRTSGNTTVGVGTYR